MLRHVQHYLCFFFIFALTGALHAQNVVVRPTESHDLLVNPGVGITTFNRYNGQPINPGQRWSEVGPEKANPDASQKPDFPDTSIAYFRWFWQQLEPEQGKYRWDVIDTALDEARRHHQTLAIRLMPYDQGHPLPEWYRNSGARRINKPEDKDGKVWSPDSDDPSYMKHWGALVREAGKRYDGHPFLDTVDISTFGYWGEGWGPYPPSWEKQKALLDAYFDAFRKTPLMVNIDVLDSLIYAVNRGAGWRLDCWGDMGGFGRNFSHMLDRYPQYVARVPDGWRHGPVSLETCWVPGFWKDKGWDLDYILEQAVRWHATSINIKSSAIPADWKAKFDEFQKKLGYRFVLRRFEYPRVARAGQMMPVTMWWLNAGVAPAYRPYQLALQLASGAEKTTLRLAADVTTWLPGDAVVEQSAYVPPELKPGKYRVRVGLLDARTLEPAIRLAIEGRQADGWYDVGEITVE